MSKTRVKLFQGAATAVITPFLYGEIDFDSFGKIIDRQIENDISAIVVCGTTGESSTMSVDEHLKCIEFAVNKVNGIIPVIAGSGSNCTKKALYLSTKCCEIGADALLVVTPYYNKATPDGLIKYYTEIADASTKPIILYNAPSRTGVNIPLSVYSKLAEHKNIIGVKEASGNMSDVALMAASLPEDFYIYSGNDDQTLPFLSLGGSGVISVVSNIFPREVQTICDAYFSCDNEKARKIFLYLMNISKALFSEVNPIPVKYAMSALGLCSPELRLPLTEADGKTKVTIDCLLKRHGLI
jgi:4-hydroxy-tetrahydrodipicolinate synthase